MKRKNNEDFYPIFLKLRIYCGAVTKSSATTSVSCNTLRDSLNTAYVPVSSQLFVLFLPVRIVAARALVIRPRQVSPALVSILLLLAFARLRCLHYHPPSPRKERKSLSRVISNTQCYMFCNNFTSFDSVHPRVHPVVC